MDNSSFAIVPFFQDNALVVVALALCGILAVLVLIGMAWGARLKRQRVHAEQEEEARVDALEATGAGAEPTEAQEIAGATTGGQSPAAPAPRPGSPPVAPPPADAAPATDPLADEPIAAAAPLDASPASEAESAPEDTAVAGEPVTRLKGLGPKVAARLGELGITTVDQLAALDDAQASALDDQLGAFKGRMARDQWREQAALLAAGDRAGYEARYGRLG